MMKRWMIAILFGLLPVTSAWAGQATSLFFFSLAGGSFRTEANAALPGQPEDSSIGGFAERAAGKDDQAMLEGNNAASIIS